MHPSCQRLGSRIYSLLYQQNILVYEFCMTDGEGFLPNVNHSFSSIRLEPPKKMIDRGITDLLDSYSLSNVLYIGDDCKWLI